MVSIKITSGPAEVGFAADRLARIDRRFDRYVDEGRLPGYLAVVTRRGEVVHVGLGGQRDLEAAAPVTPDTRWRIYSMTKPVTSVAAMILFERGEFELTDPISRWLPEFAAPRVYVKGAATAPGTVPAVEPIRVWHLLTHTAGLTYGFHHAHAVDEIYRRNGYEWGFPKGVDLAGTVEAYASMPLVHQPGAEWNYSVATDVLGRLVEVVSGQTLDAFLAEHVFGPLGMADTGFWTDSPELAALYSPEPGTGRLLRNDVMGAAASKPPAVLSGGGGLVSTAGDYHRFTQMLLRRGELDGVRLLAPRTVDLMASNHLPGNADLEAFGRPLFSETSYQGVGFGLGFSVEMNPVAGKSLAAVGEFAWGGAASTAFWVDPANELTAMFFTQLLPSSTYPLRPQFRTLTYQSLVS
ncbi:serine hydrolase domain-containing protein [Kutzneria sp. NPDC052558]|uniref:serine hydrolase domain-containing protein n=1 Tax=Kutzneria sp. NPDC052558 TaxID=3364121 RepID=UPI0037C81A7D